MNEEQISKKVAVVEMGGKQHLVFSGTQLTVEKLANKEGETIKTKDLLGGSELSFKIISHKLGKKVNGLKFKNKIRYLKRYGHRQQLTVIEAVETTIKSSVAPKTAQTVKKLESTVNPKVPSKKVATKSVKKSSAVKKKDAKK
jgi:large subunit ribosomal protein L21